jgi:hypothetical protein
MKNVVKILTLLMIVGLAGCASNSDLDAVKALAQQANATADAALKTARSAENIAQEAKATSDATENKLERMAKGKMTKHK